MMIKGPARFWNKEDLYAIMTACIILHSIIIEDECEHGRNKYQLFSFFLLQIVPSVIPNTTLDAFIKRSKNIHSSDSYYKLCHNPIKQLWQVKGDNK